MAAIQELFRARFPPRLDLGPHTPGVLYARGALKLLGSRAIGIVGSREATEDAISFAEKLGHAAAEAGIVVVSGAAQGIDSAAHRGAVGIGGASVAVLGRPLDARVPICTIALFRRLLDCGGCVVSERPPGTGFHPSHYVLRNRIIAALSDIVLVVSAQAKSGALSTAQWAKKFERPLWAVPGSPWEPRAAGTNDLLAAGAKSIGSLETFRRELGEHFACELPPPMADSDPILALLGDAAYDQDTLAEKSGKQGPELSVLIARHEASGRVRRLEDGRYVRVVGG